MFFNAVFQSVSVDKLSFLMHPSRKSAVSIFLFRAHAGFIIAQLKTLSISRGSQGNNYTLIGTGPFSSLGTAMC